MRFRVEWAGERARHAGIGGVFAAVLMVVLLGCSTFQVPAQQEDQTDGEHSDQDVGHGGSVPHERVEVIEVLAHDDSAFTQGLELAAGHLYEGTGHYGESAMRQIDLRTGRVVGESRLPAELFGEGITVVGDRIWQLTWKEHVAIERDRTTLRELRRVGYEGEGWGLCHDGRRLVMSDGSSTLTFRDPRTFARTGEVAVTVDGKPVSQLNELECVHGTVLANVWGSENIARIDPATGQVVTVINASGLLPAHQRAGADVLNGIAAVPGTDEFLLTGKYWPQLYRVRFVPA